MNEPTREQIIAEALRDFPGVGAVYADEVARAIEHELVERLVPVAETPKCPSEIWAGPGHQSNHPCSRPDDGHHHHNNDYQPRYEWSSCQAKETERGPEIMSGTMNESAHCDKHDDQGSAVPPSAWVDEATERLITFRGWWDREAEQDDNPEPWESFTLLSHGYEAGDVRPTSRADFYAAAESLGLMVISRERIEALREEAAVAVVGALVEASKRAPLNATHLGVLGVLCANAALDALLEGSD